MANFPYLAPEVIKTLLLVHQTPGVTPGKLKEESRAHLRGLEAKALIRWENGGWYCVPKGMAWLERYWGLTGTSVPK